MLEGDHLGGILYELAGGKLGDVDQAFYMMVDKVVKSAADPSEYFGSTSNNDSDSKPEKSKKKTKKSGVDGGYDENSNDNTGMSDDSACLIC